MKNSYMNCMERICVGDELVSNSYSYKVSYVDPPEITILWGRREYTYNINNMFNIEKIIKVKK